MILFKCRMKITGCDTINGWLSLSMKGSFPLDCLMRFYHKHGIESRDKSCDNMICLINNGLVKVYNNRKTIFYMSIEEELYKTYITWLPSIDSLSFSLYCFDVISMDNERIREFIFKLGDLISITKHDCFFYCYLSNHNGHSNLEPTRCDALCNFIVNFAIHSADSPIKLSGSHRTQTQTSEVRWAAASVVLSGHQHVYISNSQIGHHRGN